MTPQSVSNRHMGRDMTISEIEELMRQKSQYKFRKVRDAFRMVDVDKSGTVSLSEMRFFMHQFNLPSSAADFLYKKIDTNGDGQVDFVEFIRYFSPIIEGGQCTAYPLPMDRRRYADNDSHNFDRHNAVGFNLRKLG